MGKLKHATSYEWEVHAMHHFEQATSTKNPLRAAWSLSLSLVASLLAIRGELARTATNTETIGRVAGYMQLDLHKLRKQVERDSGWPHSIVSANGTEHQEEQA